jgi:hypothetical protein
MYDGTSLGLLSQLSHEEKLSRQNDHNSGGAVIQLRYCERDEVVVAAFAGGAVKVFCGCHRVMTEDITTAVQTKSANDVNELLCPYFQGGGPPQTPLLLRQNSRVHETTVMAMDVSDKLGLIAVSAVDGTVRVFDYYSLIIRSIYAAPFVGSQPIETVHLQFMPLTPILIGADSNGRFTAWTVYPMKPLWIITWSLQTCFTNSYNAGEKKSNEEESKSEQGEKEEKSQNSDTDSVTTGGKKHRLLSRQRRSSLCSMKSMQSFASLEDDMGEDISNGTVISSMQCVVWKTSSRAVKTSTTSPNRINWNIIVGEGNGMISIIDMTEVFEKMGLHDFNQLKQAYQLNSSAMAYNTVRRADIKDGLEDFQIREVERSARHPVGYNCFSNSKNGFKNITNQDVKGVIRWNAHPHAVSEIVCKQYISTCQMHSRSQQKEFKQINAQFKTRDYESISGCPYVVVSSSEYGVPKRWSWTGQPISEDYGGDMLAQVIAMNSKVIDLEDRDFKEKDLDGPENLPNHPSGGASQRLAVITEWAMPFIKSRHKDAAVAIQPASSKVIKSQQSRDSVSSPTDDMKSPNRRGGNMSDDDDDGSGDDHILSPSKNNTGGSKSPFVKDIVSIRRKVNEEKLRKEYSNDCWESKDRFPNHKLEINKNEGRHRDVSEGEVNELLGLIKEVKVLPDSINPVLKKSYSTFVRKRDNMHATVHKNFEKTHGKSSPMKKTVVVNTMELDVSEGNEITERELFMCDIRQLRTSPRGQSMKETPPGSPAMKGRKSSSHSSKAATFSPMHSSPSISKSGRKMISKADSYVVGSKEFEIVSQNPEDDDDLKELGLTIKRRERVSSSRQQAFTNIEATMSRFDQITSSDDKKYSYKFSHSTSISQRSKKGKMSQNERVSHEDYRPGTADDSMKPNLAINGEGGGAGRYGPYKGRDIAAFEDFMCRLIPVTTAVDFTGMDFRIGEYFPDILCSVHMGLVYEMSEVLPIVLALNNRPLTTLVKDIRVRLDGTFLREDLFDSLFIFASNCEKVRIYKFAMIRAVLIEVFKNLNPPIPENFDRINMHGKLSSPGGRHQSTVSPSKARVESRATNLFSDSAQQGRSVQHGKYPSKQIAKGKSHQCSSPNKQLLRGRSEKSLTSDGKSVCTPVPTVQKNVPPPTRQINSVSSLEGWSINRSTLEDLKLMFEDFFIDENGTVVGGEVVEIAQFACTLLNLEKLPNISFLALRRSYPVALEVSGDLIAQFFEDVLRIEVKDDMDFLARFRSSVDDYDISEGVDEGADAHGIARSPDRSTFTTPQHGRSGRSGKRISEAIVRSASGTIPE